MNIVVLHGTKGSPDSNWFPWIKEKAQKAGIQIDVPTLPTPEGHTLENWLEAIKGIDFNEETILIGHSCGATFLLHLLESHKVKKAIFVSGFIREIGIPEYDDLNASFIKKSGWDWDAIQNNAKDILIYHGSNDPYVPVEQAKELHQKIGGKLKIIKDGGHLNVETGYTQFPELWNNLKNDTY